MKNIDFNFFSDGPDHFDKPISDGSDRIARVVAKLKDQAMRVSLIEIEGYLPSDEELQRHGHVEQAIDGSQIIKWKGKPILWFSAITFSQTPEGPKPNIEYKFLYA